MTSTPLKQQLFNYTKLFRQLFVDFYRHQKKLFWLVQLLMIASTISGLFWIMGIILGITHYQNPGQSDGVKYLAFVWMFALPLWQWLALVSLSGLLSAWTMYLSIQTGVTSVLKYQEHLAHKCLDLVSQKKHSHWVNSFEQAPRIVLMRIMRQGIQLTGLVSRRINRAFVHIFTFILSFIILLYLDAKLLMLLLPLTVFYVIALYYINRYAARVSTEMATTVGVSSVAFNGFVASVLNQKLIPGSKKYQHQFEQSEYLHLAELKYMRRLAEIHVSWLNTLFLVLGIAIIIADIVYIQAPADINWQHLLFFLIALKYAANSLQQISATTVAFSRFMPEVQLVFRLLNIEKNNETHPPQLQLQGHALVYIPSSQIDAFEIQQLKHFIQLDSGEQIITVSEIRDQGFLPFFKQLTVQSKRTVIIDHNLKRMQRMVDSHIDKSVLGIDNVIVFSNQLNHQKQQITINAFLALTNQSQGMEQDLEMDTYE